MPDHERSDTGSRTNRRRVLQVGGAATVAGLAGCLGNGGGGDGNQINLGCSISLSGQYANAGTNIQTGQDFMADKINSEGGLEVDGTSYDLNIEYYDDQSDPSESASRTQQLISQDGIDLILGPVTSSITYATLPIIENNEAVMV